MSEDRIHLFEDFAFDLTRGCLLRGDEIVHLRPQTYQVIPPEFSLTTLSINWMEPSVSIRGPGAANFVVSGNNASRVFHQLPAIEARLKRDPMVEREAQAFKIGRHSDGWTLQEQHPKLSRSQGQSSCTRPDSRTFSGK